ncbi:MAG: hypothetical protein JNJ48_07875 [Phycisphaerae bacterium]|nr:hypothetical protein [Phycisphaerae bacterium]
MVRLTSDNAAGRAPVIRVEGTLDAGSVAELVRLVGQGPADIDLEGVMAIDRPARSALLDLRRRGVGLRGGSLYIARLLREEHP